MRPLTLILAFLPLIVFSTLAGFLSSRLVGVAVGLVILALTPAMSFSRKFARETARWALVITGLTELAAPAAPHGAGHQPIHLTLRA